MAGRDLRYAAADARSFYDWLLSPQGGKYAPSTVTLLIDADATLVKIKKALFEWLNQAIEEDTVTIYFAGHGSPQSPDHPENLFLLPYDTVYTSVPTTGFPMWDIETALKRFIKARKVIVITEYLDRRSGDDRRKVYDLDFFEQGGIERRSGTESRQKGDRRIQCVNVSKWSSVCPKTKSPVE